VFFLAENLKKNHASSQGESRNTRKTESTKETKNEKDQSTNKYNAPKIQSEKLWQFVIGI